jgi:4-hydroxy-3-methylbut-2-enyl diphosphate reductase
MLNVILAAPRGFCAGVDRAIAIVERAIEIYGAPVYVRHEIVHNKYVVERLKLQGAIFVSEVDEVPEGALIIFSAHGVSDQVENNAKSRDLKIIDATCPLVTKVHLEAKRNEKEGKRVILIGHKGHPEVEGTSGRIKGEVIIISSLEDATNLQLENSDNLSYVTQTTLSVDDTKEIIAKLQERFPTITGPNINDICYATQNRQNAVKQLAQKVDLILVIGAQNSSNSNRLRDLGEEMGKKSYLINNQHDIDLAWFNNVANVGITAGASAPEILVTNVLNFLDKNFATNVTTIDGKQENIHFKLPKELC